MTKCAEVAARILTQLGYTPREVELARIAAYMHDIGNVVNRHDHAHQRRHHGLPHSGQDGDGARRRGRRHHRHRPPRRLHRLPGQRRRRRPDPGRQDRCAPQPGAQQGTSSFDIHDRVNYAAERSELTLDPERRTLTLSLGINTEFCAVMDYFEIFLERMLLCRRAAEFLELTFKLDINGLSLL